MMSLEAIRNSWNPVDPKEIEIKNWIDNASHTELLMRWRFAPVGDPYFQGDAGKYYSAVMKEKRDADSSRHTAISKTIGWD